MFNPTSIYTWLILMLLGFNTGILSGFFGIGGCFILTPLLNIMGLSMANAVGTGLFFAVMVSIFGGIKHYLAGNTLLKISIIMGSLSFIGIQISQPLVIYLDKLNLADFYIRLLYIVLLLALGILTLNKKQVHSSSEKRINHNPISMFQKLKNIPPRVLIYPEGLSVSIWVLIVIALFIGLLQGFLGVGGGFILVPVLIVFLNIKPHHAIGTSLVTIIISSIFATFLYLQDGKVLIPVSLVLGLGSLAGVNFGVRATCNIGGEKLKYLYSIFLILTSIGIILKSLNYSVISLSYMLILSMSMGFLVIFGYCFQKK
ncbi:MAG: sulfite exporter TauE/SafE family protein [Candidatus Atribacteria bacterium]|nr:sulfite exporter TauE/SafE family protein [Candidatus Atribacteria bacterium]